MTKTLLKRTSRHLFPSDLPPRTEGRAMGSHPNLRHDPAELAAALRSVTTRAHRAVKDAESSHKPVNRDELAELQVAVQELESEFRTHNMVHLVPFVTSLRQQIDARLC